MKQNVIEIELTPMQRMILAANAQVVIPGGEAGGGKTFPSLCAAFNMSVVVEGASTLIARKSESDLEGGDSIVQQSQDIFYDLLKVGDNAKYNKTDKQWNFKNGSIINFGAFYDDRAFNRHQGQERDLIIVDEATQHEERHIFKLLSRLRTTKRAIRPYMILPCNPNPDSFMARLVDPWLDENKYPNKALAGKVKYCIRDRNNEFIFKDSRKDFTNLLPGQVPISITFIPSILDENKFLMEKDPSYKSRLFMLPEEDRLAMLGGCWARSNDLTIFKREWFKFYKYSDFPIFDQIVQSWDTSQGYEKGDYSVCTTWGVMSRAIRLEGGKQEFIDDYYLIDVFKEKLVWEPLKQKAIELAMKFKPSLILVEKASSGEPLMQEIRKAVHGPLVQPINPSKTTGVTSKTAKEVRAGLASSVVKEGRVYLNIEDPSTNATLKELCAYPKTLDGHDDLVDSFSQFLNHAKNCRFHKEKRVYETGHTGSYAPFGKYSFLSQQTKSNPSAMWE
jgi:predicted phage terminase large subunit-like protein